MSNVSTVEFSRVGQFSPRGFEFDPVNAVFSNSCVGVEWTFEWLPEYNELVVFFSVNPTNPVGSICCVGSVVYTDNGDVLCSSFSGGNPNFGNPGVSRPGNGNPVWGPGNPVWDTNGADGGSTPVSGTPAGVSGTPGTTPTTGSTDTGSTVNGPWDGCCWTNTVPANMHGMTVNAMVQGYVNDGGTWKYFCFEQPVTLN